MKVFLAPVGLHSRAMSRVARALVDHAPADVEIVSRSGDADLVVLHVIGQDWDQARARPDQRYAVIQYCFASAGLTPAAWGQIWAEAELVWSYYDLPRAVPRAFPFYYAPLGVDPVFTDAPDLGRPRDVGVMSSGYVSHPAAEAIEEVALAAAAVGKTVVHLGPDQVAGMRLAPIGWRAVLGISDQSLAELYHRAQWVSGLRHCEGFELPVLEGLVCGARPVVFDRPEMRAWYDGHAVFVPECTGDELVERLRTVFSEPPAPVTLEERWQVARAFDWRNIATGFWAQLLRRPAVAPAKAQRATRAQRRLLWIGDAAVDSGFARITHQVLDVLRETWDVHALGLNYLGDGSTLPYPVYPCWPGGDGFGLGRTASFVEKLQPDVVVVLNDPWNIPSYLKRIGNVPTVASLAVDGKNCRGAEYLSGLAHAIFWTEFGLTEARAGGYVGPASVIPLGVDLATYRPRDRRRVREAMGLAAYADHFIVGCVSRNQGRKRFDLLIQYFAAWVHTRRITDAILCIHRAPTGDQAFDLPQLAQYHKVAHLVADWARPLPEVGIAALLASLDIFLLTSTNEGWSLPAMEAMAAGAVCVLPDWAALSEWPKGGAVLVPCTQTTCTEGMRNPDGPTYPNVIGGVPNREAVVAALDRLYGDPAHRTSVRQAGLDLVGQPQYRWRAIGEAYARVLDEALRPTTLAVSAAPTLEAVPV